MKYSVIFEKIVDSSYPEGYYYAYIPALELTTHGIGIDGARAAAIDLVKLWIEEKQANGEVLPTVSEALFTTIDIDDAVLST